MKKLWTTSEYIKKLRLHDESSTMESIGSDFSLFPSAKRAAADAQWLVDYHRRNGKRIRRPKVYRIIFFEEV